MGFEVMNTFLFSWGIYDTHEIIYTLLGGIDVMIPLSSFFQEFFSSTNHETVNDCSFRIFFSLFYPFTSYLSC
jgi:hypothetical protein